MDTATLNAIIEKKRTDCISVTDKVLLIQRGDTNTTLTSEDYSIICGALSFVIDHLG